MAVQNSRRPSCVGDLLDGDDLFAQVGLDVGHGAADVGVDLQVALHQLGLDALGSGGLGTWASTCWMELERAIERPSTSASSISTPSVGSALDWNGNFSMWGLYGGDKVVARVDRRSSWRRSVSCFGASGSPVAPPPHWTIERPSPDLRI